ncbi:hypothetical protein DMB66_25550 [Actinoplanes sp. ATCC 53533]|nr:hypothetical protein DMB66_25550 [Actinoplanes sp. ATCC 53533]
MPSSGRFTLLERIWRREWREWKLTDWAAVASGIASLIGGIVGGVAFVWENLPDGGPACGMSVGAAQPGLLVSGYVLVDADEAGGRRPDLAGTCNSREAANSVRRTEAGRYDVRLEKLGVDGGTVEITAVGATPRVCGTAGWGMAEKSTDLTVRVVCSDASGTMRDSGFALRFLQAAAGTGALAYVRYEAGKTERNYAFNSFSTPVTVERPATGNYEVFVQDIQRSAELDAPGIVKVTSLGPVPRICNPMAWEPWQNPTTKKRFLLTEVRCHDTEGRPVDSGFVLTYAVKLASRPDLMVSGAQLWAEKAVAARYTPRLDYQYNSTGGNSMIQRRGPGDYAVELSGFTGDDGQIQVSAYATATYCTTAPAAAGRDDTTTVRVRCWYRGRPADARFSLLYQA